MSAVLIVLRIVVCGVIRVILFRIVVTVTVSPIKHRYCILDMSDYALVSCNHPSIESRCQTS